MLSVYVVIDANIEPIDKNDVKSAGERQAHRESAARPGIVPDADGPAMLFDDPAGHRQPAPAALVRPGLIRPLHAPDPSLAPVPRDPHPLAPHRHQRPPPPPPPPHPPPPT